MKIFLYIFILFSASVCSAATKGSGWSESGVLPYSYAYARSYIGYQLRKEGWICKTGFTAGAKREQEHSVWHKGNKKMQVMVWRIDSGKTGYSKGAFSSDKKGVTR